MKSLEPILKELLREKISDPEKLSQLKRNFSKKDRSSVPTNISLLRTYHDLLQKKRIKKSLILETLLRTRPIRSLSGIVNISVLTKPYPCPGRCLYCPIEKGMPKSYLSGEPAAQRAKLLDFDPYLQTQKRIEMLEMEGHPTDKIELRIVGGTWSYYPKEYQEWFVKECFKACNGVLQRNKTDNLKFLQKRNEKSKHRIIGLSIETRPDFINKKEIERLRNLGATMVELGVQSAYDDVLEINLRGHLSKQTIEATRLLKDAGFKVLYQIMPNLPGSDLKRDKEMFRIIFKNPDYKPDLLKIYPCAVLKEAPLYKLWQESKYHPYTDKQIINLMKSVKKNIPIYVRVQRIARDIPSHKISAGPGKISNLRQILSQLAKKEGWKCQCIRCREVKDKYNSKDKIYLFRYDYEASNGKEIFLSYETENREKLYSLLRLRIPYDNKYPLLNKSAIVREVHTFGQLQSIKTAAAQSAQHKGLGKRLMKLSEEISRKEFGLKKIAIISGIGAREYYKKLGYKLSNTYMVKTLK